MKPTKSRELISKTAKQLNLSDELVNDVVDFYYSVVINKIKDLNSPTIFLHGLGTLRLSRVKLKKSIDGISSLLDSSSQDDFKKVIKYNLSKDVLNKKIKSLELCNNYYKDVYEKRNKNLESKRSNSGGN